MTINRATIGDLLVPGLIDVMFDEYTKAARVFPSVLKTSSSDKAFEEWTALAGIGPAEEKPEGQGIIYRDISQLTPKRVTMVTYGLGARITMEALQDEQYGKMSGLARVLGKSFPVRQEVEMSNIFNCAFILVYATGHDGKALCATDHPIKGSAFTHGVADVSVIPARSVTTGSNKLANATDLTYSGIQDAITLLRRTVDEQGDYISYTPRGILVAPENEFQARKLLDTPQEPSAGTETSQPMGSNTLSRFGLEVWSSPYLVDEDAWFLIADSHDARFFQRMPFTTGSEDDFDTGDLKIKGVERYGLGFHDWRGIVGTPGA